MFLEFEKWHGCRNDFIVMWIPENDRDILLDSLRRQAPKLCNRDGSGIGADGFLVLIGDRKAPVNHHELVVINQDGSLAKNCGNGLRCAAGSVVEHFKVRNKDKDEWQWLELKIDERTFAVSLLQDRKEEKHFNIQFEGLKIADQLTWAKEVSKELDQLAKQHGFEDLRPNMHLAEVGNPHLVVFTDSLDHNRFMMIGKAVQGLSSLDGINMHFAMQVMPSKDMAQEARRIVGEEAEAYYRVLSWERGVGETAACGSGASCVGAVAMAIGDVSFGRWAALFPPGGGLYVKRDGDDGTVSLAGPAQFVYKGQVEI